MTFIHKKHSFIKKRSIKEDASLAYLALFSSKDHLSSQIFEFIFIIVLRFVTVLDHLMLSSFDLLYLLVVFSVCLSIFSFFFLIKCRSFVRTDPILYLWNRDLLQGTIECDKMSLKGRRLPLLPRPFLGAILSLYNLHNTLPVCQSVYMVGFDYEYVFM